MVLLTDIPPLVTLSLDPFTNLESAVFMSALSRIAGNLLSGVFAILSYIYFGNKDLASYNFG